MRISLQKLKLEKEHDLKAIEAKKGVEVAVLQSQLGNLLDTLGKLKEEKRELEGSLSQSKDHERQLQADIASYSNTKARADMELAENLSDSRNFLAATRMLNPRQLVWVHLELGKLMIYKGGIPNGTGYNPYYQYPMMPM